MFKLAHGYLNMFTEKWFYPIMFDDVVFETEAFYGAADSFELFCNLIQSWSKYTRMDL